MGAGFNFDTLMATGTSYDDAMKMLAAMPEGQIDVDRYNARLEMFSSFSAGFGDSVWFWCPGCGHQFREKWHINSGEGDEFAYVMGSVTGLVAHAAAPRPTQVAKPPSVPESESQWLVQAGEQEPGPLAGGVTAESSVASSPPRQSFVWRRPISWGTRAPSGEADEILQAGGPRAEALESAFLHVSERPGLGTYVGWNQYGWVMHWKGFRIGYDITQGGAVILQSVLPR
jgi:hypothetical protein